MSQVRTFSKSFIGGEVTPEFWGRIDSPAYQDGVALARNAYPLPHGPMVNRAGTGFVHRAKYPDRRAVVREFAYSETQTVVLEFGDHYLRFHTQGGTVNQGAAPPYDNTTTYLPGQLVTSGGVVYMMAGFAPVVGIPPPDPGLWYPQPVTGELEVPTFYAPEHVHTLRMFQSLDVLTILHHKYPPMELRRGGATWWWFAFITPSSSLIPAPTGLVVTPTSPSAGNTKNHTYVVTALNAQGSESLASTPASALNNLLGISNLNTLTWTAVPDAVRYNVYKLEGGVYGFQGQSFNTTFVDDNITPDPSYCPPEPVTGWSPGDYPHAGCYHEQRRWFGGSETRPQNVAGTRSGTESDLGASIPTREDDAIYFRVASRERQAIQHMISLQTLILFTTSAEWQAVSEGGALTPLDISVKPWTYVGSNEVQPLTINKTAIFAAARGGHVRELGFSSEAQGLITGDLSLVAPHRFDGLDIIDMAFSKAPYPIAWFVSSAGNLLSLTYVPEANIRAWASHDTDGVYESVCCVAEGNEDITYVVVRRIVNGQTVRYIERMASRRFETQADAFFVDSGLTYIGPPATVISGLDHLEGKFVVTLGDGSVRPPKQVIGGSITLDFEASKAQIGLPITAEIYTLPLAVEAPAFGQGRVKNVNKVFLRVYKSLGFRAGPSLDDLQQFPSRTTEPWGVPPELETQECEIVLTPTWQQGGQVFIQQPDPFPLTLTSMTFEVEVAG